MNFNLKNTELFKRFKSSNEEINKVQENIVNYIKNNQEINIIKNISVKSGSNRIEHKSGQKPEGYVIISRSAAITHYLESVDDKVFNINIAGIPGNATISIQVVL